MSIAIVAMVLKRKLGSTARKAVAFKLADVADDDGGNIFPAIKTIAAESEVSERTAQAVLKQFVSEGLLVVVEKRANGGSGASKTTKYRFNLNVLMSYPSTKEIGVTNRGAGFAPVLSTEPSTGVQIEQIRGANPASLGCSSCTQPLKVNHQNNPKALSSPKRRRKKELGIESDFELKGRFVDRARELGLPVDDLLETVYSAKGCKSPKGFFTTLCVKSLLPLFPEFSLDTIARLDTIIRPGLWKGDAVYRDVLEIVTERRRGLSR